MVTVLSCLTTCQQTHLDPVTQQNGFRRGILCRIPIVHKTNYLTFRNRGLELSTFRNRKFFRNGLMHVYLRKKSVENISYVDKLMCVSCISVTNITKTFRQKLPIIFYLHVCKVLTLNSLYFSSTSKLQL